MSGELEGEKNPKILSTTPTRSANYTWSFAENVLSSRVDRVGEAFRRPLADADFMAKRRPKCLGSWSFAPNYQNPNVKVLFLCRAEEDEKKPTGLVQ